MSMYSTPFLVLNLGAEMIFVIAQRLQAQNIAEDRSTLVLEDLIAGLTSNRLIKDLTKLQTVYNHEAVREIIENIANSSSMKLDTISMNKLWDLITMVFKWQLTMTSEVINVTQRHLYEIETFVASEGTQLQLHRVQNILENFNKILSDNEKTGIYDDLINWCKPFNVRVSLLLRMGLQDNDGQFVVNNLDPIAEKMLQNIGENIYQVTQNGRILENRHKGSSGSKSSLELENVNELKCFVDEMLGQRKLSSGSTEGNSNLLRFSLTDSKLNNNAEDKFDSIDVNINDNDKLQSLITDLTLRDDSEHNNFKDDLLSMIDNDQSEVV
ncbi:protein OSCP1 [Sitophilus oryzae]|uniref:Protein OSCP1 n=1 Tax=Sitophilus oryzae TaxID=7048 RepID=A0A6J2XIM6_SITOR|nr:protein OSCP1 [Sitophilus oryzae]